ncbi:helix-turn-helix domain-containing protein [Ralstonia pickettii]|uniref:Helix-turn-helix domain-containing protein n=1 Tax=Ralstonia pickettii TaxID=329 RepID=A0A7X2HMY0_RALPI|nr:helix-turn-helix domain-containing protein [Ralstonia pickettii]MRS99495.1 helix-turn-helix domain-containing protein [Ralstonia pickettii]
MNTRAIAERLREERKRLGLTQERFGAEGGVGKLAQLNYEKGQRSPDAAYLAAIALAGVDVSYVLTGERVATAMTPDEAALLAAYRDLDAQGRAGVLALIGGHSGVASEQQPVKAGKRSQVIVGGSNNVQISGGPTTAKRKRT